MVLHRLLCEFRQPAGHQVYGTEYLAIVDCASGNNVGLFECISVFSESNSHSNPDLCALAYLREIDIANFTQRRKEAKPQRK